MDGGDRRPHDRRRAIRRRPGLAVYDQPDLFLKLGNLLHEPVTRIWDRYPYKRNHFAKYLGASIYTAARSGP